MVCLYCSAENNPSEENCYSCTAPLPKRSDLKDEVFENLKKYIDEIGERLGVAENKEESKMYYVAGVLIFVALFLIYLSYTHLEHRILGVILSVLVFSVMVLSYGGIVSHFFYKSAEKAFRDNIKHEIIAYLKEHELKKTDFKNVAAIILKADAILIQFLDEL